MRALVLAALLLAPVAPGAAAQPPLHTASFAGGFWFAERFDVGPEGATLIAALRDDAQGLVFDVSTMFVLDASGAVVAGGGWTTAGADAARAHAELPGFGPVLDAAAAQNGVTRHVHSAGVGGGMYTLVLVAGAAATQAAWTLTLGSEGVADPVASASGPAQLWRDDDFGGGADVGLGLPATQVARGAAVRVVQQGAQGLVAQQRLFAVFAAPADATAADLAVAEPDGVHAGKRAYVLANADPGAYQFLARAYVHARGFACGPPVPLACWEPDVFALAADVALP